jgi:phosphoglycolate phosphatase
VSRAYYRGMYPWTGKSLDCVAFDMDGTLLDSGDFGVRAILLAFDELIVAGQLPGMDVPPSPDAIRGQIGKPPPLFYEELLPATLKHKAKVLHRIAGENERTALRDGTGRMFKGARDVLAGLRARGLKLLLVSNCSQDYMDAVVEAFTLDKLLHFRAAAGRDKSVNKTGELGRGLSELGCKTGVMVGDRVHDGEAARANGLWFIGCTYGYGSCEELAGADTLIDDIRKLTAILI